MIIDFLTNLPDKDFNAIAQAFPGVTRVSNLEELRSARGDFLLSFGTSVIVPEAILDRYPLGAVNIHAASPEFPGRDPHHWAAYSNANTYGATAHFMTKRVDAGNIIGVELREVDPNSSPIELLGVGNDASIKLILWILEVVNNGGELVIEESARWGKVKRSRKDFIEITTIVPGVSMEELARRYRAFHHPEYKNFRSVASGCEELLSNERVIRMFTQS